MSLRHFNDMTTQELLALMSAIIYSGNEESIRESVEKAEALLALVLE
jgi:hypothetical protein